MAVFLSGGQNLAGASHDGLDIAKMGGRRIRRWGKVGVLGRGAWGGRKGEGGKGGQTWRCRWFEWQESWTGKEAGREDEQCLPQLQQLFAKIQNESYMYINLD